MTTRSLKSGFLSWLERRPEAPALEVAGGVFSYGDLASSAFAIAATLRSRSSSVDPLVAVLGSRSLTAFAGILAIHLSGSGYVPLNPRFPALRTRTMLRESGCRALIVDDPSVGRLTEVLEGFERQLLVLLPETSDVTVLRDRWPHHTFIGLPDLSPASAFRPQTAGSDDLAYLLFTSGSSGTPKGVAVARGNLAAFVAAATDRYAITVNDRLSQTFDLTFDLSAFDMFVAWENGACVCCAPQNTLLNPGRFISNARLSVWFSVPSIAVFMRQLGGLKPGMYPELRWVLFCGEPLPLALALDWAAAAPNSVVENLYGPTETTIACTAYRIDPSRADVDSERGIVPIGWALSTSSVLVVDPALKEVSPGEIGELLVAGEQVATGYWRDPVRTNESFVTLPGRVERYYRTGDRVRRSVADGPLVYLGRMDHQVKVGGHRVELGEIESALREVSGADTVVAIDWPRTLSGASGIVAFVAAPDLDPTRLRADVAARLPDYMVPRTIYVLPQMPLNANGKVDRAALVAMLEASIV
jgi:amino acid adenylation domain-containing protein